jgi:hypothetical protein
MAYSLTLDAANTVLIDPSTALIVALGAVCAAASRVTGLSSFALLTVLSSFALLTGAVIDSCVRLQS